MTHRKKLGLPNDSSHSCAVSLTVEIRDASVAAQESTKLSALLQTAVDNEIQAVGFLPDATTYGMNNGNWPASNGHPSNGNGNGHHAAPAPSNGDRWNCTDGQREFILRIIAESNLTKQDVEAMAQQLYGAGVTSLDKMQAEKKSTTRPSGRHPMRRRSRTSTRCRPAATRCFTAKPTANGKPALETAIAKIEIVRGDFRYAITGLNKLGELLKQAQRENKSSDKEIQSVRQTLRSLQSIRI